jgi:adenylyl-sulfate kinase
LNRDLGFSPADRRENIRRIAEVARLMNDAGLIAITAFISPYRDDRQMAKEIIGPDNFLEVYLNTSLAVCEERDPKGFYKRAREGQLQDFTGINAPYEAPMHPEISVDTGAYGIEDCINQLAKMVVNTASL